MSVLTNKFMVICFRNVKLRKIKKRLRYLIVFILLIILFTICIKLFVNHYAKYDVQQQKSKELVVHKGVHVIIGQFVSSPRLDQFSSLNNLSNDILNSNNYLPMPGLGENGQPVYLNNVDSNKIKIFYQVNKFNLIVSDRISVNRSLPDARRNSCKKIIYNIKHLPTTSIIIVFHNEAWSTLLRTIYSILNRTPLKVIRDLILVDDASERSFLGKPLENYIQKLKKEYKINILLLRSINRIGLIKARLLGTKNSNGKTLTFLDAHVEVTVGWIEPILQRIKEKPKTIVCPLIDIINEETFAYSKSFDMHYGAINWNLHFRWFAMGIRQYMARHKLNLPFTTPIMAGGLFTIDKSFFNQIGLYDDEMDIWGGENIELSLRTWCCGGQIEIHPCSRVGHVFRKSSPYTFPRKGGVKTVLYKNLARVVEVWMDFEYKLFFYASIPMLRHVIFGELNSSNNLQHFIGKQDRTSIENLLNNYTQIESKLANISKRKRMKHELKCKNLSWFLTDIWQDNFFPSKHRNFGQLQQVDSNTCFQVPSNGFGNIVGKPQMAKCVNEFSYKAQWVVYDPKKNKLLTDESLCLDLNEEKNVVLINSCSEHISQKWNIDFDNLKVLHMKTDKCLTSTTNTKYLQLQECNDWNKNQIFKFKESKLWV